MNDDLILLGHGSGGALSHRLLDDLILPVLSDGGAEQNDAALLTIGQSRLAFTTDGYVVDPPLFPGGTIGSLAVHGTVNDLAMMGARPLWLSCALIIEEGLERQLLADILADLRRAADGAGVRVVTGDTKVVPRGKADRIFITTSGVGVIEHSLAIHGGGARPGDRIILSGTLGDHGMAGDGGPGGTPPRRTAQRLGTTLVPGAGDAGRGGGGTAPAAGPDPGWRRHHPEGAGPSVRPALHHR